MFQHGKNQNVAPAAFHAVRYALSVECMRRMCYNPCCEHQSYSKSLQPLVRRLQGFTVLYCLVCLVSDMQLQVPLEAGRPGPDRSAPDRMQGTAALFISSGCGAAQNTTRAIRFFRLEFSWTFFKGRSSFAEIRFLQTHNLNLF